MDDELESLFSDAGVCIFEELEDSPDDALPIKCSWGFGAAIFMFVSSVDALLFWYGLLEKKKWVTTQKAHVT